MKMKDLFEFGVCFEVRGGHVSNRYEEITEAQADYLENAANNHDRLVEENRELRKALEISFKANDAFLSSGEMMDYDDFERIKQLLNK